MSFRTFSLLSLSLLVVSGCGGGSSSHHTSASDSGQVLLLDPQGGHVATTDGRVALDLPAGAVAKTERAVATNPANLPEGTRVVGSSVSFSVVAFKTSANLTLTYKTASSTQEPYETDLAIYRLDGKTWTLVGGKVDAVAKTVTAPITSLGTFAILSPDTTSLVAEAVVYSDGIPGVRVTWNPAGFSAPGGTASRWQIYRNDQGNVPVLEAAADATSATETINSSSIVFPNYLKGTGTGLVDLTNSTPGNTGLAYTAPVMPAHPYHYQAQLVYGVPTVLNGGPTVGGIAIPYSPPPMLYFLSGKATSGQATPLAPPTLLYPRGGSSGSSIDFQFRAVGTTKLPLEYVIEVFASDDPKAVLRTAPFVVSGNDPVTRTIDLSTGPSILTTTKNGVFWRVGVRNSSDVPGPVLDARSGLRYLYSSFETVRSVEPPEPVGP